MENSNKWSAAAYNGLLLSLVTVIITVLSSAFPNQHNAFVSIILWIVRITASLYILYYFMRSYSNGKEEVSYKESFSYGTIICLFSSLNHSTFSVFTILLLIYLLLYLCFLRTLLIFSTLQDLLHLRNLLFLVLIFSYISNKSSPCFTLCFILFTINIPTEYGITIQSNNTVA